MKVFAINGSPMLGKGSTAMILKPFLEGMREAVAETELFYASNLNIKPCPGCIYSCWRDKPGECLINDDMQSVYPKLRSADILVLATPVYVPIPGEFQNFLNRILPLMNPVLTTTPGGRTRARLHENVKTKRVVLVSTSGWWEMGDFGTVLRIARELTADISVEFA